MRACGCRSGSCSRRAQRDETLVELIQLNVRVPEQVLGDIMASVSCLEVVDRQLVEFLSEAGLGDVDEIAISIVEQTEAAVRAALVAIPDGIYRNEVEVEAFGDVRRLVCRIDKRGSEVAIDFAGTGPLRRRRHQCAAALYALDGALHAEMHHRAQAAQQ